MSFEQEGDEAGFAASRIPLWLLHGARTEGRQSGVKEPSAFKVQVGRRRSLRLLKVRRGQCPGCHRGMARIE